MFNMAGFAFVYMEDERDADEAIHRLDRIEFGRKGRRLRVEWTKVWSCKWNISSLLLDIFTYLCSSLIYCLCRRIAVVVEEGTQRDLQTIQGQPKLCLWSILIQSTQGQEIWRGTSINMARSRMSESEGTLPLSSMSYRKMLLKHWRVQMEGTNTCFLVTCLPGVLICATLLPHHL